MKIKSLRIQGFRNIPDVLIEFNTDLTSLIIGQNGLGKSNLLEAITLIFVGISNTTMDVSLSNFDRQHFSFIISYKLRKNDITIIYGIDGKYVININGEDYVIRTVTNESHTFDSKIFKKIQEHLLPDYFVTYYSGQNRRLKNILRKFEDNYENGLKNNKLSSLLSIQRKFIYLENYHSPILILVLSLFKNYVDKDGNKIYESIIEKLFLHLNIDRIDHFSLTVHSPEWIKLKKDMSDEDKIKLNFVKFIHHTLDNEDHPFPFWDLKSSLDNFLKCLAECVDIVPYDNEDDVKKDNPFRETIEFNNLDINELSKSIFKTFENPLELFYTIEALSKLNMSNFEEDLKFDIKKNESLKISYDLLSEGENQLFLVLGFILITGIDETLYLFDEPDTYLNPKWQREYIHLLEDFNFKDDDSHIIVTTHSPLLVQNIEGKENYKFDLFLLCREEDSSIKIDQGSEIIRNWRIDQVLSSKYFNLISSRPTILDDYITEKEKIIYNNSLSVDEKKSELDKLSKKHGELPIGESINEIETILLLKEVLKSKSNDKAK